MPSLPTHALVSVAIGQAATAETRRRRAFWIVAAVCAMLPDIDAVGFAFGISYGDFWGHRGFTHSLLFAAIVGAVAGISLGGTASQKVARSVLLFVITASHGLLDAMTNGGLGIAFFSPFDTTRYFFAWRPILVSPIGVERFFSERGLAVIASEVIYVWLPAFLVGAVLIAFRRRTENLSGAETKSSH